MASRTSLVLVTTREAEMEAGTMGGVGGFREAMGGAAMRAGGRGKDGRLA